MQDIYYLTLIEKLEALPIQTLREARDKDEADMALEELRRAIVKLNGAYANLYRNWDFEPDVA